MAAAAIPLIATIAPEVIKLIVGLVHKQAPAAEQTLGAGTGPAKFGMVFGNVVSILTDAAKAGQIDKTLPSDEVIKLIIESVVSSLNLQGVLGPEKPTAQDIKLTPGQSVVVSA